MTQGTQTKLCDKKGGMEREMERRFRKEGTWVYLWADSSCMTENQKIL